MKLLTPNRNPSNLSVEQYKLVRTPEFKAWFGDWENDSDNASKVIDENGEPLVVYHGTHNEFYTFNKSIETNINGKFQVLVNRVDVTDEEFNKIEKYNEEKGAMSAFYEFWFSNKMLGYGDKYISVFLNCKTLYIDVNGNAGQGSYNEKNGDGLKITNADGQQGVDYYVVSNSNQIKLADGNNTTFDSDIDDIRFADGGEIISNKYWSKWCVNNTSENGTITHDLSDDTEAYIDFVNRRIIVSKRKYKNSLDIVSIKENYSPTKLEDSMSSFNKFTERAKEIVFGNIKFDLSNDKTTLVEVTDKMSEGGEAGSVKKKYAVRLQQNEVQYRINTLKKTIDKVSKIIKWQKNKVLKHDFSELELKVAKDALPILKKNLKRFEIVFGVMKKNKQKSISDTDFSIIGLNYRLFNLVNKSINHKYILNYIDKHPKAELTVDGVFYSPFLLKSYEDEMSSLKEMIDEVNGGQKNEVIEDDNIRIDFNIEDGHHKVYQDNKLLGVISSISFEQFSGNNEQYFDAEKMINFLDKNNIPHSDVINSVAGQQKHIKIRITDFEAVNKNLLNKNEEESSDKIKLDLTNIHLTDIEQSSIKDVLTLQRYKDLTQEEGAYLFNAFSNYESLLADNGKYLYTIKYAYGSSLFTLEETNIADEKLKVFLEKIASKKYINMDYWEGTIEPRQITIDFINSVKGRIETLGYRKIGADLFPEIDDIVVEDNSDEELQMLIELTEDTLKDNPNDEDLQIYLELLKDTQNLKKEKYKTFADGGEALFDKVISDSSRFRPSETIVFEPALIGKNGAKLISYTWAYEWTMLPNYEGELKSKRVSDWSQAESSADTGRDIVHQYTVLMPDGEYKSVSSDSVPVLLGYIDRKELKSFPNLVTASKTLAKQQMKLSILEAQEKEYNNLVSKFEKEIKPEIVKASVYEIPFVSRKIMEEEIEKGDNQVRTTYFKMGDAIYGQDNIGYYDQSENKSKYTPAEKPDRRTIEQLTYEWVSNRVSENGGKRPYGIYDLRNRVARQKRKLEEMLKNQVMADGGAIITNNYKVNSLIDKYANMSFEEFKNYATSYWIEEYNDDSTWSWRNENNSSIEKYNILVKSFVSNGKIIELRKSGEKLRYVDHDKDGNILRDEKGLALMQTDEQLITKGIPLYDDSIDAFDGRLVVGWVANSWGVPELFVRPTHQKLGIGAELLWEYLIQNNGYAMDKKGFLGQYTSQGELAIMKLHNKFIIGNKKNKLEFKEGGSINTYAVCTSSIGEKIGNSKRSEWNKDTLEKYEGCVLKVKKQHFAEGGSVNNILYEDKHGKQIVYDNNGYQIAVDDSNNARYITLWHEGKKVGVLETRLNNLNDYYGYSGKFLSVVSANIDAKHRGKGLGLKMYQALKDYSASDIIGFFSYLPNRSNKKTIPKIYNHFKNEVINDYHIVTYKDGGFVKQTIYIGVYNQQSEMISVIKMDINSENDINTLTRMSDHAADFKMKLVDITKEEYDAYNLGDEFTLQEFNDLIKDVSKDEFKEGGAVSNKIKFNPDNIPKENIYEYALMIKNKYPKIWSKGGNIFGNEAFVRLTRAYNRGYWLEHEKDMYIKWQSYIARHQHDFKLEGIVAALKWAMVLNIGLTEMKKVINEEIKKNNQD